MKIKIGDIINGFEVVLIVGQSVEFKHLNTEKTYTLIINKSVPYSIIELMLNNINIS